MPKIYAYRKDLGAVKLPEISKDQEVKELATIDGVTYLAASDTVEVDAKAQDEKIKFHTVDGATLGKEISSVMSKIEKALPETAAINAQVIAKIRERYSIDQELQLLRTRTGGFDEYNNYVESCVQWGRTEKSKMGLTKTSVVSEEAVSVKK